MAIKTSGLHHVTAIGGDPQRNKADFSPCGPWACGW